MTSMIDPVAFALFEQAQGQPAEAAAASLVSCLRLAPGFGPAYVNLANLLRRFGALPQALAMARAAAGLMPGAVPPLLSLAAILHDGADFAGAASVYGDVLAQMPAHAGALSSLGSSLQAMGLLDEALVLHASAVAADPASADAHYNYAEALLADGQFAAGWREYEWRWRRLPAQNRRFGPAWDGGDLAGRTILLHAEQGFGDTLQFVRYAPMVAARGGRVVLEVQPALVRLMRSLAGVAEIVAQGSAPPLFDTHCPLLSLPFAFQTQLHSVPSAEPYLQPDPASAACWAARIPADGRLRVGLVWAGSAHPNAAGLSVFDRRRSVALAAFAPLADVDVQLISLQTDAAAFDTAPPGLHVANPGTLHDFADTAALAATLDLVITVDTAAAHLAGALGLPVWLLSRSDACWRWLHGRDDSPWYPTMRLYRQAAPMEWGPVMERVRDDLAIAARQSKWIIGATDTRPRGSRNARAQVSSISPALHSSAMDNADA